MRFSLYTSDVQQLFLNQTSVWLATSTPRNIRILPPADGDPFKEFSFHCLPEDGYVFCVRKNLGETCSLCDFANRLWERGKEDDSSFFLEKARSFFAKKIFFSTIIVREEKGGLPKVWVYSEDEFQLLLDIVLDPNYGDITGVQMGRDLLCFLDVVEDDVRQTNTILLPSEQSSVLFSHADFDVSEFLGHLPTIEGQLKKSSSEEILQKVHVLMESDERIAISFNTK